MDTQETALIELNEEKENLSILKESPLYPDLSLGEVENFLRYLDSIVVR
jgi:hypothetical protein